LKAKCRAEAKEDLFGWRSEAVSKLNSQLSENWDLLKQDRQTLLSLIEQVDKVIITFLSYIVIFFFFFPKKGVGING
jgi:hypothetical protein